jgi:peptidoglycan/LPS O-acetylase OafA/YrhL
MILASIVLFCLAVALGLFLVVLGMRYRRSSLVLAMGHASVALLGMGLLGQKVLDDSTHKLYNLASFLFVLALFGGLVLLALRMSQREYRTPPPMFVVSLHAIMAIIAFLLLVVGYTRY